MLQLEAVRCSTLPYCRTEEWFTFKETHRSYFKTLFIFKVESFVERVAQGHGQKSLVHQGREFFQRNLQAFLKIVCAAFNEVTKTCNVSVDHWYNITLFIKIILADKAVHTDTLAYCTHNTWWL